MQIEPMHGLRLPADRIGLEQVLANLVANGLQASPPGGVVTIGAHATESRIELSVADEGPGVAIEDRERLFEPFFTTKAPGEAGTAEDAYDNLFAQLGEAASRQDG